MKQSLTIELALKTCLAVIRAEQLPDGGFLHQSWFADGDGSRINTVEYQTTFFAANILACLNAVAANFDCSELPPIRESAARFLLAQKSEYGSFNYWARDSSESQTMPYPEDLDDIFVAFAALHGFDETLIDGAAMAHIAKLLTAVEVAPGGPYRTWLVGSQGSMAGGETGGAFEPVKLRKPEKWRDVDIVVNSNIGYCLSRLGVTLPNLTQFIDDRICDRNLRSPYYPGAMQVLYFVARFYHGVEYVGSGAEKIREKKAALADMVLREWRRHDTGNEARQNPLETAMTISTLIDLGFGNILTSPDAKIFAERCMQKEFQPYPFCIDPSRDGRVCYAGSAALTAAFCAEALAKCARFCDASDTLTTRAIASSVGASHVLKLNSANFSYAVTPARTPRASPSDILLSRIKMMAQAKCFGLPDDLKALVLGQIDGVSDAEIVMVPYAMHHAIGTPQNISSRLLDELALANLFGWMAYTIYDDVLDGEACGSDGAGDNGSDATSATPHGSPQILLSAANFFLRSLTLQYAALDTQIPGLLDEYIRVMNIIDDANAWEQVHCHGSIENSIFVLPQKQKLPYASRAGLAKLADRSLGHALPALGVLFAAGYVPGSREAITTAAFFRNYLAARQLHDDAHDWKEDLLRGRINSVGARLIRFDSTNHISTLQKLFWYEGVPEVVADIIFFLNRAREAVCGIEDVCGASAGRALFKNPASLLEFVDNLQSAAERTLCERNEVMRFLDAYVGDKDVHFLTMPI